MSTEQKARKAAWKSLFRTMAWEETFDEAVERCLKLPTEPDYEYEIEVTVYDNEIPY